MKQVETAVASIKLTQIIQQEIHNHHHPQWLEDYDPTTTQL